MSSINSIVYIDFIEFNLNQKKTSCITENTRTHYLNEIKAMGRR